MLGVTKSASILRFIVHLLIFCSTILFSYDENMYNSINMCMTKKYYYLIFLIKTIKTTCSRFIINFLKLKVLSLYFNIPFYISKVHLSWKETKDIFLFTLNKLQCSIKFENQKLIKLISKLWLVRNHGKDCLSKYDNFSHLGNKPN